VVVADTGDVDAIRKFVPTDATTNPSLIFAASKIPAYKGLIDSAVDYALSKSSDPKQAVGIAMDRVAVNFGAEILKIVPGLVSTEVDARISFDTAATVAKAKTIIRMYKELGIPKERVLVKIAATWEGIKAAEILEAEGITCNMTLIFNFAQAAACADAKATLISPFVGRIRDWYLQRAKGVKDFAPAEDPGVISVTSIYNYYKTYGYPTVVMGASFRNKGEITHLAGCDKLTISPKLLTELKNCTDPLPRLLNPETKSNIPHTHFDEKAFRWALNEDPMATEKLSEGIRKFAADIVKLEGVITNLVNAKRSKM
jgi:transaldolase